MRRAGILAGVLGLAAPLCVTGAATPAGAEKPVQHLSANIDTGHISEQNKLAIIRYVDGEFAKVVRPLPSVKPGFRIKPDAVLDQHALEQALVVSLPAASPGETVQITGVEFKPKEILVNINGGSHPRKSLRDRVHVDLGMPWPRTQVMDNQPVGLVKLGSTLIVDFGGPVPDVSPDQLKGFLAPFLNFAQQRSAALNWVDSLPAKFRDAIGKHLAIAGMTREMVIAALGRADHKVREWQLDGTETEDWIYGSPPGKTIFVTFTGAAVIRVEQFP
ncbi:MAG TPA: hypothetical protein VGS20_07545 [Candidatus Acidoferrales bacterium]|nr:hypothetical protein [Candidatus Acidoferrales bacterium]